MILINKISGELFKRRMAIVLLLKCIDLFKVDKYLFLTPIILWATL